jgi:hypothetical protein
MSKSSEEPKPGKPWPLAAFPPQGGPAVRVITRGDDAQIRLTWLPSIGRDGGLDLRLHRKSPDEDDGYEAYAPTAAGLVVPRELLRDLAGLLAEIISELEQ